MEICLKRKNKVRINITIDPDVLRDMDHASYELGCSRSELIEYCYRLWAVTNHRLEVLADGQLA